MPLTAAFPLTLTLFGTADYTLADGTVHPKLLCLGTVAVEDESAAGLILLEPKSTQLLVGMEFLRRLKKALLVGSGGVALMDAAAMEEQEASGDDSRETPPPKG